MKAKGLKRQGSLYLAVFLGVLAATAILPWLWSQAGMELCLETFQPFRENFDNDAYKDLQQTAIAAWPTGPITLPRLGANFTMGAPGGMGAYIYVCAAGDFTNDGYPDLIGLDITGQRSLPQTSPLSRLVLVRNQYVVDNDNPFVIDPGNVFEEFNINTGPASITVGDYNGDGLLDFFYMRNSADEFGYTNFLAAMYINVGTLDDPHFTAHNVSPNLDFTARFQTAGIYINWAANHLHSVDIDRDGDIDILAISQDKIFLVRNPGAGDFALDRFGIGELSYDARTGFNGTRGGSCVTAADFDNDGDIDVLGGTVNDFAYFAYYKNDGTGFYTRMELAIPNPDCTGTVVALGADFTNDGWPDIFAATDRWNADNLARMWIMRNMRLKDTVIINPDGVEETITELDWLFSCLNACAPIIPPDYDVDMGTPVDYDQDGDLDIVIADANHAGDYFLVINGLANVYELTGRAQSTNIAAGVVNPLLHAVTKVRFRGITQGVIGPSSAGLDVAYYFSNNGGASWEFDRRFTGSQIANASTLPWHEFNTFGADLRWKIVMTAPEDDMAEYDGASFETPYVDILDLEYAYVDRKEYSRASAAATIITSGGLQKELLISSSFIFPGWEGQLRTYDVTNVSYSTDPYSALATLTDSQLEADIGRGLYLGTELYWDAGQLLNERSPDSRTIYAAYRANKVLTNPLARIDFTAANAVTLAAFLQDQQNDTAGLIDFIRGTGRLWKLGDINHSTPVISGPPSRNSEYVAYMGAGYAEFAQANRDRPKVIYVGANDGMLHCFDVVTGQELWGFIPYNLLPKIRNMWAVDIVNATRYFKHDIYVDGSPAVADVQINGQWRTVLITGQGPGVGSTLAGALNYYWALDVTDPLNPLPLWEITHRDSPQNRITMGETWSVPDIGKINHSGTPRWVAFMGSGYDNDSGPGSYDIAGTYFYVVRIDTGEIIRTQTITQIDTTKFVAAKQPYKYTNIQAAIPGSPSAVDTDRDGFINWVYYVDLDGRVYRLDMTGSNPLTWSHKAIYTDWLSYPIITKPAVWLERNNTTGTATPHIYFGTGGHEKGLGNFNPNDQAFNDFEFSFFSIIDTGGNTATVEWYMGNPTLLSMTETGKVGSLAPGDKVWADPVYADGIVYFSTLRGAIEAVNPCQVLGFSGRLYARYVEATGIYPAGGTAFTSPSGTPPEYLDMISKARRAVTLGEVMTGGAYSDIKRKVYIQEFDSRIEVLVQSISGMLRIKSWREVYRVIW
jgi:hypothetical protein